MAGALEGQHAEQDRQREAARSEPAARLGVHRLDLREAVERLGHDQVRAGRDLALQAVPFGHGVGGRRVEGAGDREACRCADRAAGPRPRRG